MRISALCISIFFVVVWCKDQNISNIDSQTKIPRIEGRIIGFEDDILLRTIDTAISIPLDSTGYFSQQLSKRHIGEYVMHIGMESRIPLYIGERTELDVEIDYDKLRFRHPQAINFTGEEIEESKLLLELYYLDTVNRLTADQFRNDYLPTLYSKNPSEFEDYQLEQYNKIRDYIRKHEQVNELDPKFKEHVIVNTMLYFNSDFARYESIHNNLGANDSKQIQVPNNFQDYFADEIPEDDFELYQKNLAYYNFLTSRYYGKMTQVIGQRGDYLDYYNAKVAFLRNSDFPEKIKEVFFNGLVIDYMNSDDDDIKKYLEIMISRYVSDPKMLNRLEEFEKREAAYVDGDIAPQFTYPDINGNLVSLSDFKGSLVFIDLWATWCAPCLQELPALKELKKKYTGRPIVFLGISFDESAVRWKAMTTENKDGLFEGIQLSAGGMDNKISEDYNVNGIPHYILIGPDGRIVQENAYRPTDPRLIEEIDRLIE